jgi:rare lipoprotein A
MGVFLVLFLVFWSGCSVVIKEKPKRYEGVLKVNCHSPIYTKGFYCEGGKARSTWVQPWSKVKITNLKNQKSITIAVMRDDNVEGVCVPEKYKSILGADPFPAKLDIERCGREGITECPAKIEGLASYYTEPYHNRETAYGIPYDMHGMYAAHRTLPLGTMLKVINTENHKEVIVKVIDRGPFKQGRVLDLSYGAAKELGIINKGEVKVVAYVLRCGE